LEHTADVVGSEFDVSLISPGSTPGVLDKEVLFIILSSVSDCEDTMVKRGSAGA
jgi:hypothetical protein